MKKSAQWLNRLAGWNFSFYFNSSDGEFGFAKGSASASAVDVKIFFYYCAGSLNFYCQMYYWGRDVMHPGGNLLERYGFEKIPRTTKEGTSRYRLAYEGGILELHGFCAGWYSAQDHGICFDRKHDTWRQWDSPFPPDPAAMQSGQFRTAPGSENLPLLAERSALFSRWLIPYEVWAQKQWGLAARREQHRDFVKLRSHRWWLPPDLSLKWLAAYAIDPASAPRPKTYLK